MGILELPIPQSTRKNKSKKTISKIAKQNRDRLFKRRRQNERKAHLMYPRCCYAMWFALILLMCVAIAVLVYFYKSEFYHPELNISFHTSIHKPGNNDTGEETDKKLTKDWTVLYEDIGAEGCVRLLDVDEDGKQDILVAASVAQDIVDMPDLNDLDAPRKLCELNGLKFPCMGVVFAFRGYNGDEIWRIKTRSEVMLMECLTVDVDKDGKTDCIMSGRQATLLAVDPRKGKVLWTWDLKYAKAMWNIYQVLPVPDVNNDGVADILICHGGDPQIPVEVHNRTSARLMIVSGSSGETLGRYLPLPDNKESYSTPVMFTATDGIKYVLIGSGGETVPGGLLMISLHDLCIYIMKSEGHAKFNLPKPQTVYPHLVKDDIGFVYLYKTQSKGVMVPPVIVDMTGDDVDDVLVSAYDGSIVLINGKTLLPEWTRSFPGAESYSTPAIGYFNDDDILDFMTHWSYGRWPYYNSSEVVLISGENIKLWSMDTNLYGLTSDLVLRTNQDQRDIFLFSVNGRSKNRHVNNIGEIHGVGIQRVLNGSLNKEDGVKDGSPKIIIDVELDYLNSHDSCDSNLTHLRTEVFMMDRSSQKNPIRIYMKDAEKYSYELNEQKAQNKTAKLSQETFQHICVILKTSDRITGAVGDVDGDGRLDYVSVMELNGELRDTSYNYYKMKYKLYISKLDIGDALQKGPRVSVQNYHEYKSPMLKKEKPLSQLRFKPLAEQKWTQYLGSNGNSHYETGN